MNNPLPAALTNVRRSRSIVDTGGLGSSRGAHISIRGGRFRIVSASGEETPVDEHYIDVLVCDMREVAARVYFDRPYVPGEDLPPACFSDNGTGPSTQAMAPQAPNCQMCPNNVRGTKTTFTGKPTTACETRRKLGVVLPDDPAVNVYEFQIPPGSLTNLKAYFDWIKMQASGVEGRGMDVADFITRVSFDPDRQFVMEFKPVAFADDDRSIALLKYIEENRLSDAAVGRNDVACDPEQVKLILAGSAQRQTIAAPNPAQAQARQEGQQFQLPPRGNGASLPAPAATPAAPPAPRGRGRRAQAEAPAGASATAPFMAPAAAPAAPAQAPFVAPTPPAAATQTAASPSDGSIPAFLRRDAQNQPPAPQTPPRFGVGQPPVPPPAIQSALDAAMNLPTRRP